MPRYLLDTNVISELAKPSPASAVVQWMEEKDAESCYLSVITIGEIMRGAARLPDGKRREDLIDWVIHDLPNQFTGRIIGLDLETALAWGAVAGEFDRIGQPRGRLDMQIAAIAFAHEMTLVTRNVKDFQDLKIEVVNPWETDEAS